jgi:hypothetical protein
MLFSIFLWQNYDQTKLAPHRRKGLDREEAEDETPAQEDDTEEESRRTEANAPLWTTRIAAEDDPFETTLKLAGIEKMKRRELRRMKELSADALARLTGFRQSDLRMLGGEDASPLERFQQEAEAKYGLQSSHYRDLLTSYRVSPSANKSSA